MERKGLAQELHKQARRNYIRRNVELRGLNDLYQADLVDMRNYPDGEFKYIMTIINCFSKFAYAYPMKTKTADEVVAILNPFFSKHKAQNFQTDMGTEFFNRKTKQLYNQYNINYYFTYSDKKASIIERFNRTLKTNMWRKFTELGSYEWINILQSLVKEYNNSIHSTTKFKPRDVKKSNEKIVMENIRSSLIRQNKIRNRNLMGSNKKPKFKIGDKVRISKMKRMFDKGYLPNWSNEIFTITKINKNTTPLTYNLSDEKGVDIKGGFYTEELSKTQLANIFLVEKILQKRGNKYLVRWKGHDKTFDSWVDKKDFL